jgi:hypothetical protein
MGRIESGREKCAATLRAGGKEIKAGMNHEKSLSRPSAKSSEKKASRHSVTARSFRRAQSLQKE